MADHMLKAIDVLQEYFGETDIMKMLDVKTERDKRDSSHYELSDRTVDMSLFPYRLEGPFDPPIPTPAEIAAARPEEEPEIRLTAETWRMGPYQVKVGLHIGPLQEAENLLYLERNSTVRTPKVYAAFASKDADPLRVNPQRENFKEGDENLEVYYLIMEYIDGKMLCDVEEELKYNVIVTKQIGKMLGEQLRRLRSVPPEDPTHFGSVGGKGYKQLLPVFAHPPAPDFGYYGPFKSYEECVKRLIHTAKVDMALSETGTDYSPRTKLLLEKASSALLDHIEPSDRLPVLSHLDVQGRNIMVKLIRDEQGKAVDVEEVVMIDWESLCWMPSWYEAGDFCFQSHAPVEFYSRVAHSALPLMGHVNMLTVAFFGECVGSAFFLYHA